MSRLTIVAVAALLIAGLPSAGLAADLAIVGARIHPAPDAKTIERGTILVRDGRIAAVGPTGSVKVPKGTEVIDGRGKTVVAGFWNSHVHLLPLPLREPRSTPAKALQDALVQSHVRWGFTTVFDIASLPGTALALRQRIDHGELAGPMILTVDAPLFPKDGTPIYVRDLFAAVGAPDMEVATPDEARQRVRRQLRAGADGVKLFAGAIVGGKVGVLPMDVTIARAAADEAHRAGKPVFAHPTDMRGLEVAIESGVDVLAHAAPDGGDWDARFVERLVREDIALIPTLMLFDVELTREGAPQEVIDRFVNGASRQMKAFVEGGGQVLFGTDAGYIEETRPRREFELMAAAGMDWRQILASLTTNPAKRFGFSGRKGRIAPGMDADLVVLDRDPSKDSGGFDSVRHAVRMGKLLYSAPEAETAGEKDEQVR